jgi:hypothetical protein
MFTSLQKDVGNVRGRAVHFMNASFLPGRILCGVSYTVVVQKWYRSSCAPI